MKYLGRESRVVFTNLSTKLFRIEGGKKQPNTPTTPESSEKYDIFIFSQDSIRSDRTDHVSCVFIDAEFMTLKQ